MPGVCFSAVCCDICRVFLTACAPTRGARSAWRLTFASDARFMAVVESSNWAPTHQTVNSGLLRSQACACGWAFPIASRHHTMIKSTAADTPTVHMFASGHVPLPVVWLKMKDSSSTSRVRLSVLPPLHKVAEL